MHFQDDGNLEDTQSLLSDTSSMREEMEAMREENRLLREAMEQQTRLQQDVLARFVGEMATRERTDHIAVREQQDNTARRTVMTQELSAGRPSPAVSGFEGADESLVWDAMGQPMPQGVCSPIDESLSDYVRVATGFAERPSDKVVG